MGSSHFVLPKKSCSFMNFTPPFIGKEVNNLIVARSHKDSSCGKSLRTSQPWILHCTSAYTSTYRTYCDSSYSGPGSQQQAYLYSLLLFRNFKEDPTSLQV